MTLRQVIVVNRESTRIFSDTTKTIPILCSVHRAYVFFEKGNFFCKKDGQDLVMFFLTWSFFLTEAVVINIIIILTRASSTFYLECTELYLSNHWRGLDNGVLALNYYNVLEAYPPHLRVYPKILTN